ncbi:hypothetical protein EVAR_29502_1 [Eumeta japonica]|uniref:Uncharacterized protein n=1 Tax=Eumeta variegata TaxID=151549 RepID=A0A4C1WHQ2_EUMVA|nr:hypothetical protein EVAR_29502_1 [Eumeta japonica]
MCLFTSSAHVEIAATHCILLYDETNNGRKHSASSQISDQTRAGRAARTKKNNYRKRSAPRRDPKEYGGPPSDPTTDVNIGRASSVIIGLAKMSLDDTKNI